MKLLTLLAILTVASTTALAQETAIYGGAGFFRLGHASLHRFSQAADQFTSAQQPSFGNDFMYIGGEGYARLNRNIVGAGGYAMASRGITGASFRAEPFSGGGYLHYGRIVVDQRRFWLYPIIGLGVAMVGLTQSQTLGQTNDEYTVMLPSFNARLGLGADWVAVPFGAGDNYGGLLLGLRAGCQLSPASSAWRTSGEVAVSDRPRYATNGFYVTLAIGAGGFRKVKP